MGETGIWHSRAAYGHKIAMRHKMKLTVDTIEWTSALELRESECCSVSSCIIMHSMESYSEFGLAVFTVHHEQLRSAFL